MIEKKLTFCKDHSMTAAYIAIAMKCHECDREIGGAMFCSKCALKLQRCLVCGKKVNKAQNTSE